jgi:transposase
MEAFTRRERRKIISMYQEGWETADVAQHFGASESGVRRAWQQFREQGRDAPAFANCGRKPTLNDEQLEQVRQIVQRRPDAFVHELADEIADQLGVRACRQTVGRWLRDLGITRKKSRSTPPSSSVRTWRRSATPGPRRSPRPAAGNTPA